MSSSENSRVPGQSLLSLNRTELMQMATRAKGKVHPATSREDLIRILVGEAKPVELDDATHPMDAWRKGIIGFLHDYWSTLSPQIKCPAKMLRHPTNPDPDPCFKCLDAQVIACVTQNSVQVENLIRAHKPKREE